MSPLSKYPPFCGDFSVALLRRLEGIAWHVPPGALAAATGAILVTLRHFSL